MAESSSIKRSETDFLDISVTQFKKILDYKNAKIANEIAD